MAKRVLIITIRSTGSVQSDGGCLCPAVDSRSQAVACVSQCCNEGHQQEFIRIHASVLYILLS